MKIFLNFNIHQNHFYFSSIKNSNNNFSKIAEDVKIYYQKSIIILDFIKDKINTYTKKYKKDDIFININLKDDLFLETKYILSQKQVNTDVLNEKPEQIEDFIHLNTFNYQYQTFYNGVYKYYDTFPKDKDYQSLHQFQSQLFVKTNNLQLNSFLVKTYKYLTNLNKKNITYTLATFQQILASSLNQENNNLLVNICDSNIYVSFIKNGYILNTINIAMGTDVIVNKFLDQNLSKKVIFARINEILSCDSGQILDEINNDIYSLLINFVNILCSKINQILKYNNKELKVWINSSNDLLTDFITKKLTEQINIDSKLLKGFYQLNSITQSGFNLIHKLDPIIKQSIIFANSFNYDDSGHLQTVTREIDLTYIKNKSFWQRIFAFKH
ncbi:MAG3720 family protein [Mycoplasma sp. 4013]